MTAKKGGKAIGMIGLGIVLGNLVVGLLYPHYDVFNNILVCFSVLSSTVMFYLIFSHARIHTFPFALAVIFGMSGLTKIAFSIFSEHWRNNLFVFLIMVITVTESVILMLLYIFWKERKKIHEHS